jgi:hypothetical protein
MKGTNCLEKTSTICKVVGGLILLISFISQNYLYDKWKSESDKLEQAAIEQSLMDKSALLNEILYFVVNPQYAGHDSINVVNLRGQFLQESIKKSTYGQIAWMAANGLDSQEDKNAVKEILQNLDSISSYSDFLNNIDKINRLPYNKKAKEVNGRWKQYDVSKDNIRTVYLILYIVGSVLIVISEGMVLITGKKQAL